MLDDLRFALRALARRPLFTCVVVLTLGIGVGANSSLFSLLNAALFAPLPVSDPGRLLNIYTTDSTGHGYGATSYPDFADLRDQQQVFEGLIGYSGLMTTLSGNGNAEVLFGEIVTANYFGTLGVPLALGRGFLPEEGLTPATHPVVVLGHRLWQRRFAGDSAVIGRSIVLNGHPFTVVGVAPEEFHGLLFRGLVADLWAPVMMMGQLRTDQLGNRGERWMFVKGRLAAGVTRERAEAAVATAGARLALAWPESNHGRRFTALRSDAVSVNPEGDRVLRPGAAVVLALSGLVLLVVCTNLANLMLARAAERRRDIAVRLALGAPRGRLVRQLAAESALLALAGGAAGLALAGLFARALAAFRPPLPVPVSFTVATDARVVGFTALLAVFACAVFGLAPALQASRISLLPALAGTASAGEGRPGFRRLRNLFLLPQLALSLVLLLVAGLFVRSIGNAASVDPGFDIEHTATLALDLHLAGYDGARAAAFYAELARRLQAGGAATVVTLTDRIPLDLYGNQTTTVSIPAAGGGAEDQLAIQYAGVDQDYFRALGIPVLEGRAFTAEEVREHRPVTLVSRYTAARLWPGAGAIGRTIRDQATGALAEVIGVVGDVKIQTLGEAPQPFFYRPFDGRRSRLLRFIARGPAGGAGLVGALRREVAAIDPEVAVFESRSMLGHLDVMLFPYRIAAGASSALGGFGLLLAGLGLYGVVAFGVARRTREFGIRMALGAAPGRVVRQVVAESARVVAVGLIIGLGLGLVVTRALSGVLFGISPRDPVTLVGIAALLSIVALVASYLPARRAVRVNPTVALRQE